MSGERDDWTREEINESEELAEAGSSGEHTFIYQDTHIHTTCINPPEARTRPHILFGWLDSVSGLKHLKHEQMTIKD